MPDISIIEAKTAGDVAAVEHLLRDYLLWMRRRYRDKAWMLDAYFDPQEWDSELADLSSHYGAPHGGIVLALATAWPRAACCCAASGPSIRR